MVFERRHSAKRWGDVFTERVGEILSKRDEKAKQWVDERSVLSSDQFDEDAVSVASSTLVPHSVSLKSFVRTAKRTSSSVLPPVAQFDWNKHWGNSLSCYLCNKPAFIECVVCTKCNVVAHSACVEASQSSSSSVSSTRSRPSFSLATRKVNPAPPHLCSYCDEMLEADNLHYKRLVERVREEKLRQYCALVIVRRMRIFLDQKRAMRKKVGVLLLQAFLRGKVRRRKYLAELRMKARTVVLKLRDFPAELFSLTNLVVLTVHDTFRNVQLFRYDKTVQQWGQEAIIIPGLTWHVTLLVTVAVREDTQSFNVLGQAQVAVRDIEDMLRQKDISLHFYEKVVWMPQEVHGCKHPHLIAISNNTSATSALSHNMRCTLQYLPQNPVTTLSSMVFAPPLDILKRSADLSVKKKKQQHDASSTVSTNTGGGVGSSSSAVMFRNSRYWLCLHRLKLWFFQYYTDPSPRFGSDVTEANVVTVHDNKGQPTPLLNLIHADGRTWLLEFSSRQEANKFALALQESQKALHDHSIYSKGKEMLEDIDFGFNIPVN